MDNLKSWITGGIITLVIGGTTYSFSQRDVANNMTDDTGMTQQEAEQYVDSIKEEDMISFGELGSNFVTDGQDLLSKAEEIDCENYEYDWESITLSCTQGKNQLFEMGRDTKAVGLAYQKLSLDSATNSDISNTIVTIEDLNQDLMLPVANILYNQADIEEIKNTNSFNKALLETSLQKGS